MQELKDKIKKLVSAGMDEYEAARKVIEEHSKVLLSKAEAIKKKL